MYSALLLEMLAAARQRDMLADSAHLRLTATLVANERSWWEPVVAKLRHVVQPFGNLTLTGKSKQGESFS
jgi:hypothetical protein